MRAWIINHHGGTGVFEKAQRPTPKPGPGEVRIAVAATSVNPVDYKIRSGAAEAICPPKPAVLHGDVSGVVDAVGQDVEGLAIGDPVYGCVGGYGAAQGALADYVVADARLIASAPRAIPLQDCAALPLVTITAWEGLAKLGLDPAQPQPDKQHDAPSQWLVHGGTGGVGHIVLQLATAAGVRVSTTVSSDAKAALAKNFGAAHTVDYTRESVEAYVQRITAGRGFDAVFDTVGGPNIASSAQAVKLNGQIACIQGRGEIQGDQLHARGVSLHLVFMLIPLLHDIERQRHGSILRDAAKLVDTGRLKPHIDDKRFTFDQIGDAHAYAESGEHVGKVLAAHPESV